MSTITIMNFTDIYKEESFYKHENFDWIDCRDIEGVQGYCSNDAKKELLKRIKDKSCHGIHFIDNGDYHYMTELWLSHIQEDFVLVVFDHHSDMIEPMFDMLSCCSWILDTLKHNVYLKYVILVGISERQAQTIEKYQDKIICLLDNYIDDSIKWLKIDDILEQYPFYLSIDKDVLSKKVVHTSWNQGDMRMIELELLLGYFMNKGQLIGIDICGECVNEIQKLKDIQIDDVFNEKLLEFLEFGIEKRIES
ncbi:MAG: arginase family protein [Erysipelotrichaceae bacterium]|nr:arginase family protein [Erysipelotrichaceae bacterium]